MPLSRVPFLLVILLTASLVRAADAQSGSTRRLIEDHRFGAADGPGSLNQVAAIAIGGDGRLFVADAQSREILVFSPGGRFERAFGGRGQGPGEFERIQAIGVHGDTLWVVDSQRRRLAFMTLTGTEIGSEMLTYPGATLSLEPGMPVTVTPARSRVFIPRIQPFIRADTSVNVPVLRVGPGGRPVDTIAVMVRARGTVDLRQPGGGTFTPVNVFLSSPFTASSPRGDMVAIVQARRGTMEIDFIDTDAGLRKSVSFPYSRIPLTSSLRDSVISSMAANIPSNAFPSAAEARDALARALSTPADEMPPIVQVLAGSDGTAWLRTRTAPPTTWTVVDNAGVQSSVVAPEGARLMIVGGTSAWGIVRNADDVQFIVRYRLSPGR